MKRLVLLMMIAACDPPAATPAPTTAPAQPQTQPSQQNIDVRIDLEPTTDTYGSSITAFLTIPAMGVHLQLFAVPFPYTCERGASDASDDLVVQCRGDDGYASASVRIVDGHVRATARDYGRIGADQIVKEVALPPGTTATLYAPPKLPGGG